MNLRPYPFAIGDLVTGRGGIQATVVELRGPYSVVLSDGYVTPIELLDVPEAPAPRPSIEDMLA
ncbi:hypothetical protein [Bradyrhizobium neotropicale]|uniref:hypothetical protein n=1 Tax=Bradyrhizobium neotropicale TaxID=1497615 RepID=UPI001AD6663F|nr:hypothetical protein [Bradyrhizobium neotropicale]MBO4228057.1 hypothetical protein [Bradyrhizobium neotropicale]